MKRGFLNSKKLNKTPLYTAQSNKLTPTEPVKVAFMPMPSATGLAIPGPAGREGGARASKLPHGKVPNSDKENETPKGLEELASILKGVFEPTIVPPEAARIMVTIPAQVEGEPPNPDGHVQCITTESMKQRIFDTPGYLQAVPKPKRLSHVIRDTPNMGKGVFATRDLEFGELVFAERPFLVLPRDANYGNTVITQDMLLNLTESQFRRVALEDTEKYLEVLIGRMSKSDQKAYKALYNAHKGDGSGPLVGIARSNSYAINKIAEGLDVDKLEYMGVARDGSYINHSCRPNICAMMSPDSFSIKFIARKNIKAGEQLFYSYCNNHAPVAKRQAELAPYGFVCHCESCDNATSKTDRLRVEWKTRLLEYSALADKWVLDPNLSLSAIFPLISFIEAIEKEGLALTHDFSHANLILYKLFKKLGEDERADLAMAEGRKFMVFDD